MGGKRELKLDHPWEQPPERPRRGRRVRHRRRYGFQLLLTLLVIVLPAVVVTALTRGGPEPQQPKAAAHFGESTTWGQPMASVSENDPGIPPLPGWDPIIPRSEPVDDRYFDKAAFLGDSRTEGFKLYSGLDRGDYYHSVGATVDTVMRKSVRSHGRRAPLLDIMRSRNPDRIYVMLGVNELGWVRTQMFHDRFAAVIDRLHADHPDAEIILQSIIPVTAAQDAKGSYVNNRRIALYNVMIRQLAVEKQCRYLDVGTAVTGLDGRLRPELSADGVHLNRDGCKLWLEVLRTHAV